MVVRTYSSRRIASACSADAGSLGDAVELDAGRASEDILRHDYFAAVDDYRLIAELDRGAIGLLQSEACCNRKQREKEDEETHSG